MLKVLTVVGTRPELIKMSRVIAECDKHFEHVLVHTGQNYEYELNEVFFRDLEIRKPDYFLDAAGDSVATTIAQVIQRADEVYARERPDALLLYGDTNSGLAVIPAKRRKIPVFHMEAGNRCFDQRVPEELNRKVIDHLSDINLVLSEHARRYLLAEGIKPETIIKTGSHMDEVLAYYRPKIEASQILTELGLTESDFFLASIHREENVDAPEFLSALLESFNAIVEEYEKPLILSTHPRTRNRLEALDSSAWHPLVRSAKPFGFSDFVKLEMASLCVLSDSGSLTEEASLLDLAAVTLREAHERPEGMDEGTLIMADLRPASILHAVEVVLSQRPSAGRSMPVVGDYLGGAVSKQVVRIVMSYASYVNRTVWRQSGAGPGDARG